MRQEETTHETDYLFYGVRVADDYIWGDIDYTFEFCSLPITVGVWTMNSMENRDQYGNEVDPYVSVGLPSILGIDASFTYTLFTYPEVRNRPGTNGTLGDSTNEISISLSREIFFGLTLGYTVRHDFNVPGAFAAQQVNNPTILDPRNDQEGAWVHDINLYKSFEITNCVGLEFTGGVLYTDNYWGTITGPDQFGFGGWNSDSGWNNYYISLAAPIAIGCNAVLTPHISYNGTPEGWVADGANGGVFNANENDAFYGGVSMSVDF